MQTLILLLIVAIGLFTFIQIGISMSTSKTEKQPYILIRAEKEFEIRFYHSVTMATIASTATTYKDLGSMGFRKLAGYIFGGNASRTKIAMTTPVHMEFADTGSSMSFRMPETFTPENLPKPNDPSIVIQSTNEEYVAALTFGGFATDARIKVHAQELEDALKAKHINYSGNFRFLGYNPPFQLFGRKNEIIVRVHLEE